MIILMNSQLILHFLVLLFELNNLFMVFMSIVFNTLKIAFINHQPVITLSFFLDLLRFHQPLLSNAFIKVALFIYSNIVSFT